MGHASGPAPLPEPGANGVYHGCYNTTNGQGQLIDRGRREIKVRGKGGKDRTVKIDHEAARRLDRYLRVRARHLDHSP